jgi:hypothetical protein
MKWERLSGVGSWERRRNKDVCGDRDKVTYIPTPLYGYLHCEYRFCTIRGQAQSERCCVRPGSQYASGGGRGVVREACAEEEGEVRAGSRLSNHLSPFSCQTLPQRAPVKKRSFLNLPACKTTTR